MELLTYDTALFIYCENVLVTYLKNLNIGSFCHIMLMSFHKAGPLIQKGAYSM